MFGEYKTSGGKLVRVSFDVDAGRLVNVQLSGDFFLYPEEALGPITQSLDGLSAASGRDEIVSAINNAVEPEVEMVGFSPEAIAIAVERGLRADG